MLDQVKSATSARIATARPTSGGNSASSAVASGRVNPPDADSGPENDNGGRGASRRGMTHDADREDATAASVPVPKASAVSGATVPDSPEVRRSTEDALQSLLREARQLNLEEGRIRPERETQPVMPEPPEPTGEIFHKAAEAYAQQESLRSKTEVLRPGVVFSAQF